MFEWLKIFVDGPVKDKVYWASAAGSIDAGRSTRPPVTFLLILDMCRDLFGTSAPSAIAASGMPLKKGIEWACSRMDANGRQRPVTTALNRIPSAFCLNELRSSPDTGSSGVGSAGASVSPAVVCVSSGSVVVTNKPPGGDNMPPLETSNHCSQLIEYLKGHFTEESAAKICSKLGIVKTEDLVGFSESDINGLELMDGHRKVLLKIAPALRVPKSVQARGYFK